MKVLDKISSASVGEYLGTQFIGRQLLIENVLESTNLTAHEMARNGVPEGLVVLAEQQTGGMGRNGRKWFSPAGKNLYFTLLLRPGCLPGIIPQLAIVSALSLCRAVDNIVPEAQACVKWPNDVWCRGRKLSGILCAMSCFGMQTEYALVGIGINVNLTEAEMPEDVPGTSLQILHGAPCNRAKVLASFLNSFEADYLQWQQEQNLESFLPRWKQLSLLEGRQVRIEQGNKVVSGIVDGISSEGHLRLLDEAGRLQLAYAGDAHVIPGG